MHHLYKGTAKYLPRKPGEMLRAFRRDSDAAYDGQMRKWDAVRKDICRSTSRRTSKALLDHTGSFEEGRERCCARFVAAATQHMTGN
jgi:hypothetical protein